MNQKTTPRNRFRLLSAAPPANFYECTPPSARDQRPQDKGGGGKTSPAAGSVHSSSATSQSSLHTGVSDATVTAPPGAPLQHPVLLNPQPFFYVGWIPTDVRSYSLDYFLHPDDRAAFLLLMRSQDTDPAPRRTALDSAHHRVAGATEPVLFTTWISTCDIPGSTRTAQCRLRHDYGFFDYYAIWAHFCEAVSRNGTFTVTWTCLKIGNDRGFPPLLQSASSPLPRA
ncbi:unnamed protein product [Tilletia controversa]|nr:unnamed protein product [Tilletia controversa]CAD6949693.1 unnamed protein product [Tilletia controversa]